MKAALIHRILLVSIFLVIVFSMSPLSAYAQDSYSISSIEIIIYHDGLAQIKQVLYVNETIDSITIPLLSPSVFEILVLDQGNTPLSYEITKTNITVATLGATEVTLEYATSDLTKKEGNVWTLKVNTPTDTAITLPDQSNIIYISDLPSSIVSKDNKTILSVPLGLWEISYIQSLTVTPTSATSTPPPTIATPLPTEYILIIVAIAGAIASALYILKIRKNKIPAQELRSDDKNVLQYIADKGGKVLESELRQKFILPKTSVWRLVKRLERMGYVRIRKVGIQNEIELVRRVI